MATDDVKSGSNAGNAIGVGDTVGGVAADGGAAANATSLDVAAERGPRSPTAVAVMRTMRP